MNVSIVILAAGGSTRMGAPKQLLHVEGQSLLKRVAEMAMDTPCYPIVVVLGANKALVRKELERMPVTLIDNPNWQDGMASSLKMGLVGAYMTFKDLEAVIFLTVDMPYVSVELIEHLIKKAQENMSTTNETPDIVACRYDGQLGIPVLFKRNIFNDLLELKGDTGAKKVIMAHQDKTATIDFPQGKFDLDTIEEYRNFLSNFNQN
ncbi:NTP transferase domain-containing protein [Emticicia sp. TH156]|uniref:nucleotidyltransferase family protein n=1 Tax=Emticicia sp. TH156 TaxID=2067454 RepID=UPI000C75EE18|nr:nucleotidyltransferase family protein [Emticicia sp. TH156]PLK43610.1 4-diphosphocytidyl-2C-methyl-D-erythritol synthase [Emticicia sp. TH156]